MELMELTAQQVAIMGFTIAGVVELIKRARAQDWWVVITILSSAVAGALLALYWGLDVVAGALFGVMTSGFVTVAGSLGNKSTPVPSGIINKG